MQRILRNLPYKSFEILATSCEHEGSIMCHYQGIEKAIDYVAEKPNRYMIKLGDSIEAVCTDDKRYNQPEAGMREQEEPVPLLQAKGVIKRYLPIKKKIITVLLGNHERFLRKFGNLAKYIADELDVPYGTETCRIILNYKDKPLFNIQAMHGNRIFKSNAKDFEQREANKKAALKLYLQNQMGDCAIQLCGHAHWIGIVPPAKRLYFVDGVDGVQQQYLQKQTLSSGYIDHDRRWYACCGSARKSRLDGYDDYAQNYEPNELGFVKIIVDNGEIVNLEQFLI
jgi:hypothetical protein